MYVKVRFALILSIKSLFLNSDWAGIQQCSLSCNISWAPGPQAGRTVPKQEEVGKSMDSWWVRRVFSLPSSPPVLKFKLNAIFSSFEPEYSVAELQWLLNSRLMGGNRYHLSPGWERENYTFYSEEAELQSLIPTFRGLIIRQPTDQVINETFKPPSLWSLGMAPLPSPAPKNNCSSIFVSLVF